MRFQPTNQALSPNNVGAAAQRQKQFHGSANTFIVVYFCLLFCSHGFLFHLHLVNHVSPEKQMWRRKRIHTHGVPGLHCVPNWLCHFSARGI